MIDPLDPDFASTPAADGRAFFDYVPARIDAEPAVTIVTPFFNTDPGLFAEAVVSVRRQSLQQWEWLIVDDRSTREDSEAALLDIEHVDPRIRVIRHGRNRGVSAARNTAIGQARSPFVLLLDSDDVMEPTTAEKWLWFLTSHPECAFVDGLVVCFGQEELLWTKGFNEREAFLDHNFVGARCLVQRDVLEAVGGFDESIAEGLEDWDLWLRCGAAGHWGETVPEFLAWYRRSGRDSERARWPSWDHGAGQKAFHQSLRERYPHLWHGGFPQIERLHTPEPNIELEALPTENLLTKRKRRLLLIQPWAQVGGADKFNLDLVAELNGRGWETTIVTTLHGDHSWLPHFCRLTPDVFALMHFLKPEDYARFLRYVIQSRQPDAILIAHSLFAYKALPYLRRVAGGIPIADYCHIVEERWFDGGYPRLSVEYRDCLDLQIASSEALREWMVQAGAEPERVEVCYTNIDPDGVPDSPSRTELGLPEDVPILVYPCRISEQKQPAVFARTLLELRRRGYPFLALAVGDGPYLPWLQTFVRRNNLNGHVRMLGRRPNRETQELIGVADCVFIPSTHEGISLAFYEAMAAGVPVVGADVGGQRELVTPECGVLVQRGRPDDEVLRYTQVLAELLDEPDRRRAMGRAGRTRIRTRFTLDSMGDRMDMLLGRAADLARTQPQPTPSDLQARRAALEAIRIVPLTSSGPAFTSGPWSWRLRVAVLQCLAVLEPLYRLALKMGFHSVEPLKDRIFYALVPPVAGGRDERRSASTSS